MTPDYADRLVDWVRKYRVQIIVICCILLLLSVIGAVRSGFNTDARAYFGPDNPDLIATQAMEARHGRYNTAIVLLAPKDGTIFSLSALEALADASRQVGTITDIFAAQSFANLESFGNVLGWPLGQPLVDPDRPVTEETLLLAQKVKIETADQTKILVSEAGHVAAINMLIKTHESTPELELATVEKLRALISALSAKYPAVEFHLTGSAVLNATFMDAIQNDILFLVPFQVVAIVGLLLIFLQSMLVSGVLLALLGLTCAMTMGIAGWLDHDLNGVTSATPMVLMGLAIATSIHILLTWQQELRKDADPVNALKSSIRVNTLPISLATLTTMISFLCLNFSDSPPFQQLGNLVAIGIVITYILAFTLLPALTTYLPPRPAQNRQKYEAAFGRFGEWVGKLKYLLIAVFVVTAGISGWGLSRLVFDDNFAKYFSEQYEFRRSTDFLEQNLSGLTVIDYSVPAENGVTDPGYLNDLNKFTQWLRRQPKVTYVSNFSDIIAAAAKVIPFVETENGMPVSRSDVDMVWARIQQSMSQDMPPGRPISPDNKHSIVTLILADASSQNIRELSDNTEIWLRENTPSLVTPATGMAVLAANMSARNTQAMVIGTITALILVSIILLISLRSLRQGMISLIPNIMPMIIAYGLWGFVFGEISFAATVVSAMTFGIVVDDTVHFLWKYRYARTKLGLSPQEAIPQSFSTVGVAILVTTLSIVSGFAALAFSGFLVNAHLGALTVLTLIAALFAVFLFLPPFLLTLDKQQTY